LQKVSPFLVRYPSIPQDELYQEGNRNRLKSTASVLQRLQRAKTVVCRRLDVIIVFLWGSYLAIREKTVSFCAHQCDLLHLPRVNRQLEVLDG
jgi:hypothetical protein